MVKELSVVDCYKKAFELLDVDLKVYVEQMAEFTGTMIAVGDITGKVLAEAGLSEDEISADLIRTQLTAKELLSGKIRSITKYVEFADMVYRIFPVKSHGNLVAYVIVADLHCQDQKVLEEMAEVLERSLETVFERQTAREYQHDGAARRVISEALFADDKAVYVPENYQEIFRKRIRPPFGAAILRSDTADIVAMQKMAKRLENHYADNYFYIKGNYLYILFPGLSGQETYEKLEKYMEKLGEQSKAQLCMTQLFSSISELKSKCFLMENTLRFAGESDTYLAHHEYDYYMEAVCMTAVEKLGTARYMDEKLNLLKEEDEAKNTEFYDTLREYFFVRNNVSLAAKRLFIHRNTMIYRLRKISEILEVDINDPDVARKLSISMALRDAEKLLIRQNA